MKITKVCTYRNGGNHFNILPALLVTPIDNGLLIALKWWDGHLGIRLERVSNTQEVVG